MGRRRKSGTGLPTQYLRRVTWAGPDERRPTDYPFSLPFLNDFDWKMEFTTPVTIITGENGCGKSTLIEAIGGLAGYDETGGGKGYRPIDYSTAHAVSRTYLAEHLCAAW